MGWMRLPGWCSGFGSSNEATSWHVRPVDHSNPPLWDPEPQREWNEAKTQQLAARIRYLEPDVGLGDLMFGPGVLVPAAPELVLTDDWPLYARGPMVKAILKSMGDRVLSELDWDWPEPERAAGGVVLVPGDRLEEWMIQRDFERVTGLR